MPANGRFMHLMAPRGGDEDPVVPARTLISDIKYQRLVCQSGGLRGHRNVAVVILLLDA